MTVNYHPPATPTLTTTDVNLTLCQGETIRFLVTDSLAGSTYDFKIGATTVQSGASATFRTNALADGNTVTVEETTVNGCVGTSAGLTFTVNACADPSVVINKYCNGGSSLTADPNDVVELLVIHDNLDMRGMIIKDFGTGATNDGSTKFTFTTDALWSSVASGTLIILRNDGTAADTDGADYVLDVGLENSTYFTPTWGGSGSTNNFNIANTDMVQIKVANSGTDGISDNIHAFMAGDTTGTFFEKARGFKLNSTTAVSASSDSCAFANNGTSTQADFHGTDAFVGTNPSFGGANNTTNSIYICSLRDNLAVPTVTSPDFTFCTSGSATLTVTPGGWASSAAWYDAPTGGTQLHVGTSFTTPTLTSTTTYYVASYDPGAQCESARVAVTVTIDVIPADPGIGANEWHVLGHGNMTLSDYLGYYVADGAHTVTIGGYGAEDFEFNTALDGWTNTESPSDATGWDGCQIGPDNFSLIAKRKGFPCGYYNLFWQYYDDNALMRIDQNGDGTFETTIDYLAPAPCCATPGVVWSGYLGDSSIIEIEGYENTVQFNVHIVFDRVVGVSTTPVVDIDDVETVDDVCEGSPLDIHLDVSTYLAASIIEPVSVTYNDGTTTSTATGLTDNDTINVTPPAGTTTYTFTTAVDGAGCTVTATDNTTVTTETPPSAANITTVAFDCNGAEFLITADNPTTGTGTYSIVSGSGSIAAGALPATADLTSVTENSTTTVRFTVSNGTGICPDEIDDRAVPYLTSVATPIDPNVTCTPNPSGGAQHWASADGSKIYATIDPSGNNIGLTTVELPGNTALLTPASYWTGTDVPLGAYTGGSADPPRMPSAEVSCPPELFVRGPVEIDVTTEPSSNTTVTLYIEKSEWDDFLTNGNTWLDAVAGRRADYEGCYVSFPAATTAMMSSNVFVTAYHFGGGRTLRPITSVVYEPARDVYLLSFTTDMYSTFNVGGGGNGTPLPIDLVDFWGEVAETANVLEWLTATETNVSHFEVERSVDAINFSWIGEIEAAGTTVEPQAYRFDDHQPLAGGAYYRLKVVDLDGSVEYTDLVYLERTIGSVFAFVDAFPNPFAQGFEVQFSNPSEEAVRIRVVDLVGRVMQERELPAAAGVQSVAFDLGDAAAGAYIVELVRPDGQRISRRVVKSRD